MSDTNDEQRRLAPGIAAAMRNVRNAEQLSHRHRHRWNLPSDEPHSDEPHSEPDVDEQDSAR